MRIQLLNLRKILSRPSTLAKVEVEAKPKEDKKVVEAKIPTKANSRIKSLMTQNKHTWKRKFLRQGESERT